MGRTPGARLGERTASSGSSVELVCAVLARRWPWPSVRLWPDPPMPPSPPRLPATTSTATARLLPRPPATNRTSPPTAPRAADFAQEPPRQPQTPATTCTATAPTFAVTEHTQTSARRPAANAEENPFASRRRRQRRKQHWNVKKTTSNPIFSFHHEIFNYASQQFCP